MNQVAEATKNYFDYLENVLGIKSIIDQSLAAPAILKTELLIGVENYQTYNTDEIDLLQKMLAAVKVEASRMLIVDLAQMASIQKTACIFFKDELTAYPLDAELCVQTFSPRILLKNPELKKVAWTELQKVLQFFTNRPTEV